MTEGRPGTGMRWWEGYVSGPPTSFVSHSVLMKLLVSQRLQPRPLCDTGLALQMCSLALVLLTEQSMANTDTETNARRKARVSRHHRQKTRWEQDGDG